MAASTYLAMDYGAGSGRAIIGKIDNKITLEEIHRFPNKQIKIMGHYHWDILALFDELKKSLNEAKHLGYQQLSGIGVETWGVDFGLIGKDNVLLGNPVTYRDSRTDGMMEKAFSLLPKSEIYEKTGIQFMQLNSIYQLLNMVMFNNPLLDVAEHLLFIPDLLCAVATILAFSTIAPLPETLNVTGTPSTVLACIPSVRSAAKTSPGTTWKRRMLARSPVGSASRESIVPAGRAAKASSVGAKMVTGAAPASAPSSPAA